MMTPDQAIGDNVRRHRVARELSQDQVAELMQELGYEKWSQSTVWSVEKGSRPLRLTEAADLAQSVLGLHDAVDLFMTPEDTDLAATYMEVVRRFNRLREDAHAALQAQAELRKRLADETFNWENVTTVIREIAQQNAERTVVSAVERAQERWEADQRG